MAIIGVAWRKTQIPAFAAIRHRHIGIWRWRMAAAVGAKPSSHDGFKPDPSGPSRLGLRDLEQEVRGRQVSSWGMFYHQGISLRGTHLTNRYGLFVQDLEIAGSCHPPLMAELCKIILVDDSEDDVWLFQRVLARHPRLQLLWRGENGDQAIAYLSGSGKFVDRDQFPWPDLLVLDLKMPNRDGFEVLQWMQGKANMPLVVVLSSSDLPEDRLRAAQLGATGYQPKPFDPDMLDHILRRVLRLCDRKKRSEKITEPSATLPLQDLDRPSTDCSK
jgi:CheY-like chemotaxis protein